MPFRRSFSRGRRAQRHMDWGAHNPYATSFNTSSASNEFLWILDPNAAQDKYVDPTVRRIVGNVTIFVTSAPTIDLVCGLGIIMWPGPPVAMGTEFTGTVSSIPSAADRPGPIDNANFDWMWTHYFGIPAGFSGAATILGPGNDTAALDIRAQRKLGNHHGIAFCTEIEEANGAGSVAFGLRVVPFFRVLLDQGRK